MSGRFDFSANFRRAMARMKELLENWPSFPVPPPIYDFMLPRPFPFDTRTDDPLVVLAVAHELLPVEALWASWTYKGLTPPAHLPELLDEWKRDVDFIVGETWQRPPA